MKTASWMNTGQRFGTLLVPVLGIVVLSACASRPVMEAPYSYRLAAEVRSVLGAGGSTVDYLRARTRLQEMGPEIDVILVGLVGDTRARPEARADALLLLADRRSPLALPTLESALQDNNERLRSAAVLGLNRLAATTPVAVDLIRQATRDRSRTVRLNAMQSLDIREVETIREVLERETDPEVRQVGVQLVALAESRGAPLASDRRGTLRNAVGEGEPQIVFRPVFYDSAADVARGDLRIELADGPDLPLAASATAVSSVVPAFFAPDRSSVVVESNGEIRVVDVSTRHVRNLGPGIAPRPIPFTQHFVFVRESAASIGGDEVLYEVLRAPFADGDAEIVGQVRARLQEDLHAGESPVRWMVVDETDEGFALRAENMDTFQLPISGWTSGAPSVAR
jgi:hypothetical protein